MRNGKGEDDEEGCVLFGIVSRPGNHVTADRSCRTRCRAESWPACAGAGVRRDHSCHSLVRPERQGQQDKDKRVGACLVSSSQRRLELDKVPLRKI